jgi:outer membrane protein assembly factor BamB
VDGRCVQEDARPPVVETTRAPEPAAPVGPSWARGGPGLGWPSPFAGPESKPEEAWSVDLGSVIFATPTIAHSDALDADVAYVGTPAGRFAGVVVSGPREGEIALDLDLGGLVWGTAALDEAGRLYVGTDRDTLYAIDPSGGRIVWEKRLGDCDGTTKPGPEGARCDVDGGPTYVGGEQPSLYVGADGVYKLAMDGAIQWQWPPEDDRRGHVFSSPVVTEGGRVYVGDQKGRVVAIDPDGTTAWTYDVRADVDGSGVLGADGTFFVGADDGRIYALRPDGSLRWSFVAQRDIRSALARGPQGRLFATSFDKNLYAITPAGDVDWVLPTGGIMHASPVIDRDGVVYVGAHDDQLYAVTPEGTVKWRVGLAADIDSSVALTSDGTLVVGGDDGALRAFRAASG